MNQHESQRSNAGEEGTPLLRVVVDDGPARSCTLGSTGRDLDNLAIVLKDLGELVGARPLLERAVAIAEAAYRPEHPTTRAVQANLIGLAAVLSVGGR